MVKREYCPCCNGIGKKSDRPVADLPAWFCDNLDCRVLYFMKQGTTKEGS